MKKNSDKIIRSTKVAVKFANRHRRLAFERFVDSYREVCQRYIDLFWDMAENVEQVKELRPLAEKRQTDLVDLETIPNCFFNTFRMKNFVAKQALGIVRGTKVKHMKRLWMMRKLMHEGKDATRLQKLVDGCPPTKPLVGSINPELSSKGISVNWQSSTSFDGWLTIHSLGNRQKILIPFKKTKHWLRLERQGGRLMSGVCLTKRSLIFRFEMPKPVPTPSTKRLGLDLGIKDLYALSNGTVAPADNDGWNMDLILERLARRKWGSKGFVRTERQRQYYINWALKQLDLADIGEVVIERLRHVRKGKRTSRKLSHFSYGQIIPLLKMFFEGHGVRVLQTAPQGTSQRCSKCGWTQKVNRSGKAFCCRKCGSISDADINAACNLVLGPELERIPLERFRQMNRQGFYWQVAISSSPSASSDVEKQERGVPAVPKAD